MMTTGLKIALIKISKHGTWVFKVWLQFLQHTQLDLKGSNMEGEVSGHGHETPLSSVS